MKNGMDVICGRHGRGEKCVNKLVEKPEMKRPLGEYKSEDNIK
jgi:hypothetical protein